MKIINNYKKLNFFPLTREHIYLIIILRGMSAEHRRVKRDHPHLSELNQKQLIKSVSEYLAQKKYNSYLKKFKFSNNYGIDVPYEENGKWVSPWYVNQDIFLKRCKEIENHLRKLAGLPLIGEKWISETLLKNNVNQLLRPHRNKCKFHYRPVFLRGKELDIYFEFNEKKIGIEYQGQQHYKPVKLFGGKKAFENLKKRDRRKKIECKKAEVILIYFNYKDNLTLEIIKNRIEEKALINLQ